MAGNKTWKLLDLVIYSLLYNLFFSTWTTKTSLAFVGWWCGMWKLAFKIHKLYILACMLVSPSDVQNFWIVMQKNEIKQIYSDPHFIPISKNLVAAPWKRIKWKNYCDWSHFNSSFECKLGQSVLTNLAQSTEVRVIIFRGTLLKGSDVEKIYQ